MGRAGAGWQQRSSSSTHVVNILAYFVKVDEISFNEARHRHRADVIAAAVRPIKRGMECSNNWYYHRLWKKKMWRDVEEGC